MFCEFSKEGARGRRPRLGTEAPGSDDEPGGQASERGARLILQLKKLRRISSVGLSAEAVPADLERPTGDLIGRLAGIVELGLVLSYTSIFVYSEDDVEGKEHR